MSITPLYIEDCQKFQLNTKGMYLQGFSKAGDRTGFMLYPHKILFDCGVRVEQAPPYILNTHCHVDHTGELPYICNKHKLFDRPSYEVYTPSSTLPVITLLIKAIGCVSNPKRMNWTDEQILVDQRIQLKPVNAGDKFMIKDYEVQVLEAHHDVQSVGYGISSFVKKLKEEYKGLSGKDLGSLRKSGIEIQETVKVPEIAFFCDSTIHNLSDHSEWKEYPIVVCECTGLDGEVVIDNGHTGITELLPIMLANDDKQWVLIHTSRRLKPCMMSEEENKLRALGLNVMVIG
jgi:ribonuclease Z